MFRISLSSSHYLVTGCLVYWQSTNQSLLMLDWSINIILEEYFNIFALPAIDTSLKDDNIAHYWYLIDHQSTPNTSISFFIIHMNIFRPLSPKYHRNLAGLSFSNLTLGGITITIVLFWYHYLLYQGSLVVGTDLFQHLVQVLPIWRRWSIVRNFTLSKPFMAISLVIGFQIVNRCQLGSYDTKLNSSEKAVKKDSYNCRCGELYKVGQYNH